MSPNPAPTIIATTEELAGFCTRMAAEQFITVDTEFHRERTYYAKLCLIQVAGDVEAAIIDPLAPGIDLAPLWELLADAPVLKVFHACRQDMEIFHQLIGRLPAPIFDTQIAAQFCGFGESPGYETLVSQLLKRSLDKSQRFTDWQRRPLTARQLDYAIADVTHLRDVYTKLVGRLSRDGREGWIAEAMAEVTDPATYVVDPREQWRRLRLRNASGKMLAALREVAAWREEAAKHKNLPRQRVLTDDALLEIAQQQPADAVELQALRSMRGGLSESWRDGILAALATARALPQAEWPSLPGRGTPLSQTQEDVLDVLRLLLKIQARQSGLVPRLLAGGEELEALARGETANLPCLDGWRRDVFGSSALDFLEGRLSLTRDPASGKAVWR